MASLSILLLLLLFMLMLATCDASSFIDRGFSASPDRSSSTPFQPLLTDPTGLFALGFLRVDSSHLDLAVLHLPSSLPLWRATPSRPALWAPATSLSFDGALTLSDPEARLVWSTSNPPGDRLSLSNSSNLQILKLGQPPTSANVLWQSFDFPSDTLVQGQNFTSGSALLSTSQRFSMSLGLNYLALYMELGLARPMYWKHTALEERAQINPAQGPIYARVEPGGFLGLYQGEGALVTVLNFDTFSRGVPGLRRLTLESDGNLKAYYFNGSTWLSDFSAVTESCSLPAVCGPYGVCSTGQPQCRCVDNRTHGCFPPDSGDLCGAPESGFRVVRRKGVELANKEFLGFERMGSLEECEGVCQNNCSCWGAVYNNISGSCYQMDYPVQTLVEVGDERKVGYFKVRDGGEGKGSRRRTKVAVAVAGAVVLVGAAGFAGYRVWSGRRRRGGVDGDMADGLAYKGLRSSSFGSVELSNSFRK